MTWWKGVDFLFFFCKLEGKALIGEFRIRKKGLPFMTSSEWLLWIGGKGCDGLLVNAVVYYNLLSSGMILSPEVTILFFTSRVMHHLELNLECLSSS